MNGAAGALSQDTMAHIYIYERRVAALASNCRLSMCPTWKEARRYASDRSGDQNGKRG